MENSEILNNIIKMQNSNAQNYFESKERFFLINTMEKIKNNTEIKLSHDEISLLEKIFKKYLKFSI
tara:strand:- start:7543 stop:7740 length:198 start_codon:yes stop_codon:yes gene_type:complete